MAVENKFKLNVIAASVLMGLSLSAVAETAPAKPAKTFAGLAAPVKGENIQVKVTSVSSGNLGPLSTALADTTEGSAAKALETLTAAQGTYDGLSPTKKELVTKLNDATKTKDEATQTWNDFGHKLSAANSVYTDNLNSMYGDGHNAFKVDGSSGNIVADADKGDGSTYGQLLKAYDDLNTSVTNLNKAIVGDIDVSGGKVALNVFANGSTLDAKKAAQKAEAQVFIYSNYINKAIDVKTTELQLESVRNIVINNISTVLGQTDQTSGISDTSAPGSVGKNLKEFKDAYSAWSQASTAADKATKETTLAKAFQTLVQTTGITGVTNGSTAEGVTFDKLAAAWVKLTGDGVGSVAKAQEALTDAKNYTDTSTDTPHDLFDKFEKKHDSNVFTIIKTLSDADITAPTDINDALKKLQTAYRVLLGEDGRGNGANVTELGKLNDLMTTAWKNHITLSGMQAEYAQKKLDIQQAGNNRLNLLLNELPDQQAAFLKAQTEYQAAKSNYTTNADVTKAWNALYGSDNKSGALGAYLDSLKATSDGIKGALVTAESAYTGAIKGATQEAKNTALYTLIGTQKTLAQEKLKLDTTYLNMLKTGVPDTLSSLVDNKFKSLKTLTTDLNTAATNKAKAKSEYIDAVKAYRDADTAYQKSKSEADAATLASTKAKLMTVVGVTSATDFKNLYANGTDTTKGFKSFDELAKVNTLSADKGDVFSKYNTALEALSKSDDAAEIQQARKNVVDSMNRLADLMPLSTPEEQTAYRTAYNSALNEVGVVATTADEQSTAPGAGKVTHILGSLGKDDNKKDEIAQYNPVSGNYNSVILNTDGKGIKDSFTANDLYTGTQDNPFTTTVLDIRALELGNGKLSDPNTITVGEAVTKDKKATPVEVWAKTAGAKHQGDNDNNPYVSAENGPAVKLSGNLRTATAQLDADGKPMENEIVRGADQIHLQNVNIHNSFTLADRTKMLADDMAAITSEAADKLKLGQPADGVNAWQKAQTALLNSKYDNLKLTGLQIATKTVNPTFDLDSGGWKNAEKTVTPTDANILLDNLNITLQNDSVGGVSTAIALSGTGNHILANGGVFDAGQVTGKGSKANVLDFGNGSVGATNNRVDFDGSVLKGDIVSTSDGNQVNLNNSTLTGNAASGDNQLALALNSSTWTGASGQNSPDVTLLNNSVWNVKAFGNADDDVKAPDGVTGPYSSVRTLALYGSNSINLVSSDGQAQLGGHGFAGTKSAVTLKVDNDLFSDGKGVTSVLAGTYSPDNLHSLTNTGSAGNYQFGTLNVDGLAKGGKYALSLESAGAEPYTIGGRLADSADATHAHEFVSYTTNESRVVTGGDGKTVSQTDKSDADFTSLSAPAELGVYQYAAEKVMDAANNRTNIYYSSTGQLSNSAATVVSLAAAPVDVANLQSDTLAKHMNSVRHGKDSGVWVSYFGGESRNTTASGPEYKLNTNGVMLGADTLTENNWLAGVAVSSARSDMSVMNSSGDLNSYGAQFYMSRRYDSGVFVDSALQFNHFSNTAKARMTDGQQAKADFSGNSYGLEAKVGYAWNSEGFFAEPYVRAAARAFDGEHYALSNGMTVNSNDYKSMLGEVGADLGYQYAISGGYVKPYLHLAALNEFADGNSVRVNNVSLDDSVKGAAFQAGLGAEVKVTDNLGGYAAFDYTKGDNTERPWQATVGVNYTW
ncbi:TPA: autotransporter outer membrane beta-barrel domain-containing protein [Salmonella enterica]|uniref:Autotransporter outer membrane beta-barrel domain-containing protein n=1 Tax=Salmonella enterica TaxID=28901 RepID=A0A757VZK0_SALER|nr:autotransporter outer membrane beta-barrel domain-containing protein [Salmonella enterica]